MIQKYFLNFWIWWYGVKLTSLFQNIYSFWSLSLSNLNILPMVSNLFVPMYQDRSFSGRLISFILRLNWIFFGSVIQFLITIPLIVLFITWVILPIACIIQILRFIV